MRLRVPPFLLWSLLNLIFWVAWMGALLWLVRP